MNVVVVTEHVNWTPSTGRGKTGRRQLDAVNWTPTKLDADPTGRRPNWTPAQLDAGPTGRRPNWTRKGEKSIKQVNRVLAQTCDVA